MTVAAARALRRPGTWRDGLRVGSPLRRRDTVAVVILTVLGASLRFAAIGRQGFWIDEAYTAQLVHLPLGKMFGLIPQTESTPPLYYSIAWVWTRLFGDTEAGLRSLSALVGVATVPVAYAAGRQLITPRAGVIAAALTACNPLLIWYSQEARSYELLVLLTSISLLAFARARVAPARKTLSVWVIASALALTTHYYALLAVIPQAVWLLALYPRQRRVQVAAATIGLCGLALLPLAISQAETTNAAWIGQLPLGLRLGQLIQFLVSFQAPVHILIKWIAVATMIIGLLLLTLRSDFGERRGALVASGLALGGFLLSMLMLTVGIDNLISRNLLALWLPAALVLAAGLGARRAGLVGPVAAALLCATGIAVTLGVVADRKLERPDWRAVAHLIGATPAPNVRVRAIVIERWGERLPLSLIYQVCASGRTTARLVSPRSTPSRSPRPGFRRAGGGPRAISSVEAVYMLRPNTRALPHPQDFTKSGGAARSSSPSLDWSQLPQSR